MNSTISKTTEKTTPKLGITVGDPAGVGPELCGKIAALDELWEFCSPVFLGDPAALKAHHQSIPDSVALLPLSEAKTLTDLPLGPLFVDFQSAGIDGLAIGTASDVGGAASFRYIDTAIEWARAGKIDGIVTGPINKLALHKAGHKYPGHTEILAEKTSTDDFCMMQYSEELTCTFVTTHVGYAEVPGLLNFDRILKVIQLSVDALRSVGVMNPKLVACGLNPHAGEEGLFGNREEERIIIPALDAARAQGIDIEGPFPPDTCFIPSRRQTTDCFICMYHDQGHIPLKALVFDRAVNVTLGLPIVRTSVDHGTAYDIVGKNIADPSSLIEAIKLAAKLARNRAANKLG